MPSLAQAHARLRIEHRHFDLFIAHLRDSLRDVGANEEFIGEIMAGVLPLSTVIVNTPSGMGQVG
jgi:truncated hemoglobin YjbI